MGGGTSSCEYAKDTNPKKSREKSIRFIADSFVVIPANKTKTKEKGCSISFLPALKTGILTNYHLSHK